MEVVVQPDDGALTTVATVALHHLAPVGNHSRR